MLELYTYWYTLEISTSLLFLLQSADLWWIWRHWVICDSGHNIDLYSDINIEFIKIFDRNGNP